MAFLGWFDSELYKNSWFEPELNKEAWFDSELIPTASGATAITVSDNTGATYSGCLATMAKENAATTNYSSSTTFEAVSYFASDRTHGFILPSGLSSVGAGTVTNGKIRVRVTQAVCLGVSVTQNISAYILSRNQVQSQLTWNNYSTGNAFTTGGGLGASDANLTAIGTIGVPDGTTNTYFEFTGAAVDQYIEDVINGVIPNYGILLARDPDTAYDTAYVVFNSDNATDGFRPSYEFDWVAGGGGSYTLTALTGAYALSGQSAVLTKSKLITANAGAYTYAGISATLSRSRRLTATTGGYVYAGQSATLNKSKSIVASTGGYLYTGQSATLTKSRLLIATNGNYVYAGNSAVLTYTAGATAYTLTALTGSYTVTGNSVTLIKSKLINANAGAYNYTGISATLNRSKLLAATTRNYAYAGVAATLTRNKRLIAQTGSYTVSGQSAVLTRSKRIVATAGNYSLAGNSAILTHTIFGAYTLTCLTGSYVYAGNNANLVYVGIAPQIGHGFEMVGKSSFKDVVAKQQKLRGEYNADEILKTPAQAFKVIEYVAKESIDNTSISQYNALETLKAKLEASSIKWRDYYATLLADKKSQYLTEAIRQEQKALALDNEAVYGAILLEMQKAEAERQARQDDEMAILALILEL